jgi:hypothetical protein
LIPNPILKVLSSMRSNGVRALLMGGQACVFYGAAEFSRDTDLAVLADYLHRGHAVHFRCMHPEAYRIRVDVMSTMRGVAPFPQLWKRRTQIELPGGSLCDVLSLPDLVQAKKTQRDKDWPMIRRLVEAHYFENQQAPNPSRVRFWFRELRTPELLTELGLRFPSLRLRASTARPLLNLIPDLTRLEQALVEEEMHERRRDRDYLLPLKSELERLRHAD